MRGESIALASLTELQRDLMLALHWVNYGSSYPQAWCRPMDLGASNGSHHSGTLQALARKGLVRFKQRRGEEPPEGENGRKLWRGRGSKSYQVTPAGRLSVEVWRAAQRAAC